MIKSNKYDVIRFTEFNGQEEKLEDICEGELLCSYIERTDIDKESIYALISNLMDSLYNYKLSSGNRLYGCINPYNVLITGKGEVLLLNMNKKSNMFVRRNMKIEIMKKFYVDSYIEKGLKRKIPEDIFTFAVTVDYIIHRVQSRIRFSYLEYRNINKVISKCIGEEKRIYREFDEIKKDLNKTINIPYRKAQKKTTIAMIILDLLLVILSFVSVFF